MKIVNQTKGAVLAEEAALADILIKRLVGLLGRKGLKQREAIILKPCNSIHTLFMRFPIDVIFVDKENRVIKAISALKPWRLTCVYWKAQFCVELPAGTIRSTNTTPLDFLQIS